MLFQLTIIQTLCGWSFHILLIFSQHLLMSTSSPPPQSQSQPSSSKFSKAANLTDFNLIPFLHINFFNLLIVSNFCNHWIMLSITVKSSNRSDIDHMWTLSFIYQDMINLTGWLNQGACGGQDMWHAWGRGEVFTGFWLGDLKGRDH